MSHAAHVQTWMLLSRNHCAHLAHFNEMTFECPTETLQAHSGDSLFYINFGWNESLLLLCCTCGEKWMWKLHFKRGWMWPSPSFLSLRCSHYCEIQYYYFHICTWLEYILETHSNPVEWHPYVHHFQLHPMSVRFEMLKRSLPCMLGSMMLSISATSFSCLRLLAPVSSPMPPIHNQIAFIPL